MTLLLLEVRTQEMAVLLLNRAGRTHVFSRENDTSFKYSVVGLSSYFHAPSKGHRKIAAFAEFHDTEVNTLHLGQRDVHLRLFVNACCSGLDCQVKTMFCWTVNNVHISNLETETR